MRRLAPPATGLIALLATALTLAGGGLTGPSRAAPIEQAHLRSSALRASSLAAADGDRARCGSAKADEPTESVAFGYQFLAATPVAWPNASSFSGPVDGTVDTDWPLPRPTNGGGGEAHLFDGSHAAHYHHGGGYGGTCVNRCDGSDHHDIDAAGAGCFVSDAAVTDIAACESTLDRSAVAASITLGSGAPAPNCSAEAACEPSKSIPFATGRGEAIGGGAARCSSTGCVYGCCSLVLDAVEPTPAGAQEPTTTVTAAARPTAPRSLFRAGN